MHLLFIILLIILLSAVVHCLLRAGHRLLVAAALCLVAGVFFPHLLAGMALLGVGVFLFLLF